MLDDGKPQTRAAHFARAVAIHAVETLGQARDMHGIYARPVVDHRDAEGRTAQRGITLQRRDLHLHLGRPAAVFDRILDQIAKDLAQLIGIAFDKERPLAHLRLQGATGFLGQRADVADDRAQKIGQIQPCIGPDTFHLLDLAEREKIAHQPVHPLRFGGHDAQKAVPCGGIILGRALQGFDEADQGGQGRAQFMADIGHEIAAHLADLLLVGDIFEADEHAIGRTRRDMGAMDRIGHVLHPVLGQIARRLRQLLRAGGGHGIQHRGLPDRRDEGTPLDGAEDSLGPGVQPHDPVALTQKDGGQRHSVQDAADRGVGHQVSPRRAWRPRRG